MSENRVRESRSHGSRWRELEIGYGADIEALSTERESKPTRPTCSHYASSRPYRATVSGQTGICKSSLREFRSEANNPRY